MPLASGDPHRSVGSIGTSNNGPQQRQRTTDRRCCREDFKLRKDVEVRRFRWTVTDTAISRDSGFLLYCSISPQAHLVRIGAGGAGDVVHSVSNITEVHEEIDFLVSPSPPPPAACFVLCSVLSIDMCASPRLEAQPHHGRITGLRTRRPLSRLSGQPGMFAWMRRTE